MQKTSCTPPLTHAAELSTGLYAVLMSSKASDWGEQSVVREVRASEDVKRRGVPGDMDRFRCISE